jgi:hypothetical protein
VLGTVSVAVSATGCSLFSGPGPSVVGTYSLAAIDGRPLPTVGFSYRWREANGTVHVQSREVLSGRMVLLVGGVLSSEVTSRWLLDGVLMDPDSAPGGKGLTAGRYRLTSDTTIAAQLWNSGGYYSDIVFRVSHGGRVLEGYYEFLGVYKWVREQ